jgi:glycosyltransferase involved in cell wall biosynthesis
MYPKIYIDSTKKFWKLKKEIYSKIIFNIVTPSDWLYQRVKKSPLLGKQSVNLIYNGINTHYFQYTDKSKNRKKYNIPKDKFIVLFIAA